MIKCIALDHSKGAVSCGKGFCTRAQNNSRSTDNVRNDWNVDWSTFRLASHGDWSHSIVLKINKYNDYTMNCVKLAF